MFHCRFCTFMSRKLKDHIKHRTFHSNLSSKLFCGYGNCKKFFKFEVSLRSHLKRTHNFQFKRSKQTTGPTVVQLDDPDAKYICSLNVCRKEFDNYPTFIKHLKEHIKDSTKIKCPFHNCESIYSKLNSFTSHLSKTHKHCKPTQRHSIADEDSPSHENSLIHDNILEDEESCEELENNNLRSKTEQNCAENVSNEPSSELFLLHLAQFFLKLETQFLIPVTTIQYIVLQICSIHEKGQDVVRNNLVLRLYEEHDIPLDQANGIIDQAFKHDPFLQIENSLGTAYKRREFYTQNFAYVHPVKVWLGDKTKGNFFHYVPLQKTLIRLFNNKSLEQELQGAGTTNNEENILKDFTDGAVFKQNPFFQENPRGLKLILYQDSFEVVNPLGAAKTKYKILAVYLNIGNLPDHVRSHVNSMQLVALCREKLFDHKKVYGRIVKDLKEIETEGVKLPSGEVITGAVVFIAGDNLGSHSLGGFVENFSSSTYFCRYCLMKRNEFYCTGGPFKIYAKRTVESYEKVVSHIRYINGETEIDETIDADGVIDHTGIKFNSIFNELRYYHVCLPGLPPCLGHDVLEGLTAYDLKLYLDYFVKKQWFSYDLLNKRIDSFATYSTVDYRDKPCSISRTAKRLSGGAWQLCTFLRLLPLLIGDKIQDIDDDVWKCVLLLGEIVEIICAPEIHNSYISYLRIIIHEYIDLRQQFVQPLRPKHHFLLHYPELILQFGPLMKVWTLRFESKHTFFKRVIRYIKNFKNVTRSLSVKHELLQTFLRSGGDIRSELEMIINTNFEARFYNHNIREAINSTHLPENIQECSKIIVKGVHYARGDALFVAQESYQYKVEVGRIVILLCDEEEVFVVVEVLETIFRPHLRAYELGKKLRYECLRFDTLSSTENLHIYNTGHFLCVKPIYGLVKKHL